MGTVIEPERPLTIRYAQCWEDPSSLRQALGVSPADDVLSIASGGENTFALLLDGPRSLIAVDSNPAQLFMVELKACAMQRLDYDDFVSFLGVRPCRNRERLYRLIRHCLSAEARAYWNMRSAEINRGVIHCGKFERYFAQFRRWVLPLVHKTAAVAQLLAAPSVTEQRMLYDTVWNNRRWRALFRLFFGKFVMGHLGRDASVFQYVTVPSVSEELLRRARRGVSELPLKDNYFIEYILTGRFSDLERCHPYMATANFNLLRERVNELRLVQATLGDYLMSVRPVSFSKFNLSDIFEYMSEADFNGSLRQILRSCRAGASLAFWTTFVPRAVPRGLTACLAANRSMSERLFSTDRTFFYGSFNLWEVASSA